MSLHDNDDAGARPPESDFDRGQVALLLAETILHMLVEKNLLRTEDAVSALQTTAEVKLGLAEAEGEPAERTRAAIDALFQMMDSFAVDLDHGERGSVRSAWEHRLDPK